jgi:branched-chain amino acid transport system ATP-binding protein
MSRAETERAVALIRRLTEGPHASDRRARTSVVFGLADRIARLGLGYVPENRDIFPGLTVRQNLILGIKDTRRPGKWRLEDMLQMFPNLAARADTAAGVLSSGEKQMLTICRTLMGDPGLVMIDEPTEGLAPIVI